MCLGGEERRGRNKDNTGVREGGQVMREMDGERVEEGQGGWVRAMLVRLGIAESES